MNTFDLCSESTGRLNSFDVDVDVGDASVSALDAKACSLADTPCIELPGDKLSSAVLLSPILLIWFCFDLENAGSFYNDSLLM